MSDNSPENLSSDPSTSAPEEPVSGVSPVIIFIILALVIGAGAAYLLLQDKEPEAPTPITLPEPEPEPVVTEPEPEPELEPVVTEPEPEPFVQKEVVEATPIEAPEPVANPLPNLDESDSWFAEQLNNISWRKELVRLVVKDDTIRRFVVFTDNFANGIVAYEHSPLKLPKEKFEALELDGDTLVWDEQSAKRFEPYIQLLRSVETDKLVSWYLEAKPLVDEAYAELGYPDTDFTETILVAIERVLESDIMQSTPELVRPSVMYKFADERLESMSEADKLLMRLGKDNLVMLKATLLEVDEKLKAQ